MTVSIAAVIPTFDRPELLVKAVASVVAQQSPADEIIVVDNGTMSVSPEILPAGVRLLRIAPRAGVSAARNAGTAAAASEYVAFLDDDDRWESGYLKAVRSVIADNPTQPDVILARKDRQLDGVVSRYKEIVSLEGLRGILMVKNPGVGGQNLTAGRNFVATIGGFRTGLRSGEDRAFLIDALDHNGTIALAPSAIAIKIIHPGEQITDGRHNLQSSWLFLRIYWKTMDRRQRNKNLRRVMRAIRSKGLKAVRGG